MAPDERHLMIDRKGTDVASPETQLNSVKNQIWLRHSQGGLVNIPPSAENMVLPVELHLWLLIFNLQVLVGRCKLPQVVQRDADYSGPISKPEGS